ncbi:MAG TPA: hypothetical protein VL547_22900 [Dinghuibacter sp.]|uniref:hypothetical protein n=1 Tax=Dinghuibacter sp. TaxID=2024697 RepID=UPI002C841331|nr:hypothetical protein [Dinghuibacter sp.]HTJ14912.1 hypothetical protein [Dinghuibacter sp.]
MRKWLSLLVLACAACAKHHNTGTVIQSDVVGNWRWVMQHNDGDWAGNWSGPPLGDTLTPQRTGIQEILNLNVDGTYSVVDNGWTVQSGRYRFDTLLIPGGPVVQTGTALVLAFIRPGQLDSTVNHWIVGDTLYTDSQLITTVGVESTYVRDRGGIENPE